MRIFSLLKIVSLTLALLAVSALAVLDIPNTQPKVSAAVWNPILDKTWEGLKKRNIEAYGTGLIHRPKSETPGDAVSEGVGYGMILALYANDQETFNRIWDAGEKYMFNNYDKAYDWRVNQSGQRTGTGPATDADEDIALMLIFADKLVQKGIWKSHTSPTYQVNYAQRAQDLLNAIWNIMIENGKYVRPGAWGGASLLNAGYFSPASYRIFKQFDANSSSHNWDQVIEQCYQTLQANTALYEKGMIPDWSDAYGNFLPNGPGYNAYLGGKAFFKDAIRILWRISMDAIWFNDPNAKEFLTRSLAFINSKGGAPASNYYQLEGASLGELLPEGDKWTDFNDSNNPETWRWRREHSHLTIGMWATAAMAVGTEQDQKDFSLQMSKFYENDARADFFGKILDTNPSTLEDTLHNEMYFDQFLAWFGVSTMTGVFSNVIEDLDHPKTATEGIVYDPYFVPNSATPTHAPLAQLHLQRHGGVAIQVHAPAHWGASTQWILVNSQGQNIHHSVGSSLNLSEQKGIFWVQAKHQGQMLTLQVANP